MSEDPAAAVFREEAEAVPAESIHLERSLTANKALLMEMIPAVTSQYIGFVSEASLSKAILKD